MYPRSRHWLTVAVMAVVFALVHPPFLDAQLFVENPSRRWRGGEIVELLVRGREVRLGARIEEVRLNGRPIAFDLVDPPGTEDDVVRIRIRLPLAIRPGAHQVSVRFSEESRASLATVPTVIDLPLAEARRLLAERGFLVDTRGFRASPLEGSVLMVTAQEPLPGARMRRGERVVVGITRLSRVPDIVGLDIENARLELLRYALELAVAGKPSPALGQMVGEQDPSAGAVVATGSVVTVESVVAVPDLVGRRPDEVRPILSSAGLRMHLAFVDPVPVPYRAALDQDPAAGYLVPPGSPVKVVFEPLADPPPARFPWIWVAATAALGGALVQQRARVRRGVRESYRVRASKDLDGLRQSATEPAWEGRELRLDVRLLGIPDPGRQAIEIEGPLVLGPPES